MRPSLARGTAFTLIVASTAAALLAVREWAYGTTYRLYVDARIDDPVRSSAAQRFDLGDDRVVPKILMRDDRIMFRAALTRPSTLRLAVAPDDGAMYAVRLTHAGISQVLAEGGAKAVLALPIPAGPSDIELAAHGRVAWADARLERHMLPVPLLLVVVFGSALTVLRRRYVFTFKFSEAAIAAASLLVALIGSEGVLRAVGVRVSTGIREARHHLGEWTEDPRWEFSSRLGVRLRPNIDVTNEWRYGDIVRMGFMPSAVAVGERRRYRFRTDAEGFRNATVRDTIDVAALGDSFTDAQTLPEDASWPAQLERRSGLVVQNYGTAGFGPQQELRVLDDYALRHRPRVVVLAFFAGNDIYEAEALDANGRIDGAIRPAARLGWPIKSIVSRADTWYLVNAWQAAAGTLSARAAASDQGDVHVLSGSTSPALATFDRGMFTLTVHGRVMRVALMPPYLNTLNFSEADLAGRRGWRLTRETLTAMRNRAEAGGASFVVAFLPSKSQVVLPLLDRLFSRRDLSEALAFSLRDFGGRANVDRLLANRLALNSLMRQFCDEAGIALLDLTTPLQDRMEAGEEMFFSDDSHLNAAGQSAVADALLVFLRSRVVGR